MKISPKTSKSHQLFMKMTSPPPIIWKNVMSHKLHLIRNASMAKVAKKLLCWKFARQIFLSTPPLPFLFSLRSPFIFVTMMIMYKFRNLNFSMHPRKEKVVSYILKINSNIYCRWRRDSIFWVKHRMFWISKSCASNVLRLQSCTGKFYYQWPGFHQVIREGLQIFFHKFFWFITWSFSNF